jgi:hypothetical protein
MSKTHSDRPRVPSPLFKVFIKEAKAAFGFLIKDYHCFLVSTNIHPLECSLWYRNSTTGVQIEYEVGVLPTVFICKLKTRGSEVVWKETYPLRYLIGERCPNEKLEVFDPLTINPKVFRAVLSYYGRLLQQCGSDVLEGNFSIFPLLKRHSRRPLK